MTSLCFTASHVFQSHFLQSKTGPFRCAIQPGFKWGTLSHHNYDFTASSLEGEFSFPFSKQSLWSLILFLKWWQHTSWTCKRFRVESQNCVRNRSSSVSTWTLIVKQPCISPIGNVHTQLTGITDIVSAPCPTLSSGQGLPQNNHRKASGLCTYLSVIVE